jgi:2-polyprenyl-3-methyl-5-hydroxy-6-metoxy-1,4-benzoquinol methylase
MKRIYPEEVLMDIKKNLRNILHRLGYTISKIEDIKLLGAAYIQKEGIEKIPLIAYNDYLKRCPPHFKDPVQAPNVRATGITKEPKCLRNASMKGYFEIEENTKGKGYYFTDNIPNHPVGECYHNRQYMLFSTYLHFFGDDFSSLWFLDVAGSSGYYSFHAARLGFKKVLCIDGREEHRDQFYFLKKMLPPLDVDFCLLNVEELSNHITDKFDVVSAQGILYHLYDQALFLRNLHRMTGKVLILDTLLNGRMDNSLQLMKEDPDNLRDSPFSRLSLAPSLPVTVELLRQAGFTDIYIVPYPGMVHDGKGKVIDNNGYGIYRRVMLVAAI